MNVVRRLGVALPLLSLLSLVILAAAAPKRVSYQETVAPLLRIHCSGCHTKTSAAGGLSLDTPDVLRNGGTKFGRKIVVPGKPAASALVGYLRGTHQPQMPMGGHPLTEAQIRTVERWIAEGATIDAEKLEWPYVPIARVTPPAVAGNVSHPIDRFVLAKLRAKGLTPAPPAPKVALIRRLYLDLVGMPPTPQETDAFFADTSPNAYENLVDRLLADPRFGERWARHWLDLVRFAETHGFEADNIRARAWRYRDYVIRAFNVDKPYDRFLQEQVAGDELFPKDPDAWIATGFLRLGSYDELSTDPPGRRQETLNDATDTLSSAVLGMTVGCARCHDHKYDRISQRDYYRLQAFFVNTEWREQSLPGEVDPPAVIEERDRARQERKAAEEALDRFRAEVRTAMQKADANDEAIDKWLSDASRKDRKETWDGLRAKRDDVVRRLHPIDAVAETVTDRNAEPPKHHVLVRGNLTTPGEAITPGFIAAFSGGKEQEAVFAKPEDGRTSGARSALAAWLTSPRNPMTARVIVNRLWQHHFGVGLVGTPSDFGVNSEKTAYPELVDYLAGELIRRKWSLKAIHRLILTSATYRQSAMPTAKAKAVDPANRLFRSQNRQRLEAEAIRDSVLSVSGGLNPERGGPSIYPALSAEVLSTGSTRKWGSSPEDQQRRRTIYVFQRRSLALPIAEVFDGPDMVNSCPRRNTTTIAPQALALFNGEFVWNESRRFADRLLAEEATTATRITRAYRTALVRRPTDEELRQATLFLERKRRLHQEEGQSAAERMAWADLCHVLFNTNEFVYAD
ncbi:MAG: PSD1 and planctomycete cytochrome C domain-containing protein [Capsulimonadales bacterium]|nr:PSD1 and planctomycete cytochrome C domain-containing protein [Capsulimonadales bacterium]